MYKKFEGYVKTLDAAGFTRKTILAFAVITVFAGMGAYMVFSSKAAVAPDCASESVCINQGTATGCPLGHMKLGEECYAPTGCPADYARVNNECKR